jgi:outer membrane protein TolC
MPAILAVCLAFSLAGTAQGGAPGKAGLTFREALIRVAEKGHPVRIAQKAAEAAHEDINRARSELMPQVSVNAGRQYYAYQPAARLAGNTVFTSEQDFNFAGIGLRHTLYDFGSNSTNAEAAKKFEDSMGRDTERVRNQSVLEFITVYFDVLESDRLIAVAGQELASLGSHLHDITVLYREGVVTKNDLLTAQVKFGSARQRLVSLKDQRKVSYARLCSLLALGEDVALSLEDPAVRPDARFKLDEGVTSAVSARSELLSLDDAIQASEFREKANRLSGYPELFADGGYTYAENRYQDRNDNWTVKVGLKFNVFDGGLVKAETAKEARRKEQLAESRKKTETDIRVEVEKAYWDLKTSAEKIAVSRSSVAQARENLRVSRAQYLEGGATSTAVLDAIALLTGAETDLWRGTYEEKRAWARLLYATGKDLVKSFGTEE